MNIAIDAILYHEKPRGVGRYLNNLLYQLSRMDKLNNYYIFYAPWMKQNYDFLNIRKNNFHLICLRIPRGKLLRNIFQAFIFPILIKKYHPNVLHIPDTSPIFFKTCRTISTIHDLAEYHFPEKYSYLQAKMRKCLVKLQILLSDNIITISKYSMDDLIRTLKAKKNKINVIYNGIDTKWVGKSQPSKNVFSPSKAYFLYVGEIERTKNVPLLIKAYKKLPNEIKKNYILILVGKKGNDFNTVVQMVRESNLSGNVKFLNYVNDNELIELYKNSSIFIFPSLFEGFGLPIIEAMACKCSILCSKETSLPEIGGDSVILFNPYDENDLSSKIIYVLKNKHVMDSLKLRGQKRVKMFSWERCARRTLEIYNK